MTEIRALPSAKIKLEADTLVVIIYGSSVIISSFLLVILITDKQKEIQTPSHIYSHLKPPCTPRKKRSTSSSLVELITRHNIKETPYN